MKIKGKRSFGTCCILRWCQSIMDRRDQQTRNWLGDEEDKREYLASLATWKGISGSQTDVGVFMPQPHLACWLRNHCWVLKLHTPSSLSFLEHELTCFLWVLPCLVPHGKCKFNIYLFVYWVGYNVHLAQLLVFILWSWLLRGQDKFICSRGQGLKEIFYLDVTSKLPPFPVGEGT